jgi:eukaryotic-like serine/threonine-protein kinase
MTLSAELIQAYAVTLAPLLPGEVVAGRYRLEEVIGIGAHSTVYCAIDERLSVDDAAPARVALKLSREPMAVFEFKRMKLVKHPHVAALRDRGVHEGLHFLISDYVPGNDLTTLPQSSPKQVAALIAQVCQGVAAAHARGVSHGDLKPANILLDEHGPVVADFGGGRTASYTPPEGGDPTPAADVWSLGVILAELVPDPPRGLRRIIQQAQDPDPQQRPTASLLGGRLEAWIQRRPPPLDKTPPLRRFGLWVVRSPFQFATVVLILLTVFGAGAGWQLMEAEAQRRADLQTEMLKGDLRQTFTGWFRAMRQVQQRRNAWLDAQGADAAEEGERDRLEPEPDGAPPAP